MLFHDISHCSYLTTNKSCVMFDKYGMICEKYYQKPCWAAWHDAVADFLR